MNLPLALECPPEKVYEPYHPHDVFHVATKWLIDLNIYNEWMNELDYQVCDVYGMNSTRISGSGETSSLAMMLNISY